MESFKALAVLAVVAVFPATVTAQFTTSTAASFNEDDIRLYSRLYSGSAVRELTYNSESSPLQKVCEDICLEAQVAARRSPASVTADRTLAERIRLRQDLELVQAWLRHEVGKPTEPEIREYYQENKDSLASPEQVTFHHLFLLVPPDDAAASASTRARAQQLAVAAKSGADFETLIIENSQLESARKDRGRVGPVVLGKINPALRIVLSRLQPGQISDPVRTAYGWEVLRLDKLTSLSVPTIEQARDEIAEAIVQQKARKLKDEAPAKLAAIYSPNINEKILGEASPNPNAVLATVADRHITVGETSSTIEVTEAFAEIPDMRDRIRKVLPQLIMIEQIRVDAAKKGLLESPMLIATSRLIKNRMLAEDYFKSYVSKKEPASEELLTAYKAEADLFRTPAQARGRLYRWDVPAADYQASTTSEMIYAQTVLANQITSLTSQVETGQITLEDLCSRADENKVLDWFREGPMGYHHDMAWFKTGKGQFTNPYPIKNSMYLGYVEDRREAATLPFEEVQQQVRIRLKVKLAAEERDKLLQELLQNCTHCRSID